MLANFTLAHDLQKYLYTYDVHVYIAPMEIAVCCPDSCISRPFHSLWRLTSPHIELTGGGGQDPDPLLPQSTAFRSLSASSNCITIHPLLVQLPTQTVLELVIFVSWPSLLSFSSKAKSENSLLLSSLLISWSKFTIVIPLILGYCSSFLTNFPSCPSRVLYIVT